MTAYDEAVAGWAAHLRAGGTTTWAAFRASGETAGRLAVTPDATHLELLRRLNAVPGGDDAVLQDLVLATPAPGRGRLDTPLAWPDEPRRFGPPPVEPDSLPDEELIRLATGVLARLTPQLPAVPVVDRRTRVPLPWRPRVQVHGSPATGAAVKRMLLDQGVVESSWRPVHLVVARPLEVMMAEHWATITRLGAIVKWRTLWRRAESTGRLPAGIDVTAIAGRLAASGAQVHLVVAHDAQHVAARAADLLGVREVALESGGDLSVNDLVRRMNRLLAVIDGPPRVRDLTGRLLTHVLPQVPPAASAQLPFVPPTARAFADEVLAQTLGEIDEAGYPVHGDPGALAPQGATHDRVVDRARTLEIALHSCVVARRLTQHDPTTGEGA